MYWFRADCLGLENCQETHPWRKPINSTSLWNQPLSVSPQLVPHHVGTSFVTSPIPPPITWALRLWAPDLPLYDTGTSFPVVICFSVLFRRLYYWYFLVQHLCSLQKTPFCGRCPVFCFSAPSSSGLPWAISLVIVLWMYLSTGSAFVSVLDFWNNLHPLFWWGMRATLSVGIKINYLECSLKLYWFREMAVIGFALGFLALPATGNSFMLSVMNSPPARGLMFNETDAGYPME